jgi:hypothetical protein
MYFTNPKDLITGKCCEKRLEFLCLYILGRPPRPLASHCDKNIGAKKKKDMLVEKWVLCAQLWNVVVDKASRIQRISCFFATMLNAFICTNLIGICNEVRKVGLETSEQHWFCALAKLDSRNTS